MASRRAAPAPGFFTLPLIRAQARGARPVQPPVFPVTIAVAKAWSRGPQVILLSDGPTILDPGLGRITTWIPAELHSICATQVAFSLGPAIRSWAMPPSIALVVSGLMKK